MTREIVLFTGGDGQLGTMFLCHHGHRHTLRLTHLNEPFEAPGHEVVQLDVTDFDAVLQAMEGVSAVVHFAADSAGRGPWESMLPNNIVGAYNVIEAARQAAVKS